MKALILLAVCAFLAGPSAFATKKPVGVTTSFDQIPWAPLDPKAPDGIQIGVVSGDPTKGAASFYLKMKKGANVPHTHSSDYHAVIVKGEAKHWTSGTEDEAPELERGSYWFQPKRQSHTDSCQDSECVVFLHFMGKFDFIPSAAAEKK
jgi:quercetin dioxygenase-like cupin family protein